MIDSSEVCTGDQPNSRRARSLEATSTDCPHDTPTHWWTTRFGGCEGAHSTLITSGRRVRAPHIKVAFLCLITLAGTPPTTA